jgi:hypothetical protein
MSSRLQLHRSRQAGVVLAVVALFTAACDESQIAPSTGDMLALGTWGGKDAAVLVTEAGAHVHVGCTFGDVTGKVPLDSDGRFTVDGTYVLRAFPVLVGPTLPAQFSGQVRGETLTLAVAVDDTVEKKPVILGPVSVVFGNEPDMGPCPVCVVKGLPPLPPPRRGLFWRLRHWTNGLLTRGRAGSILRRL